MTSVVTFRAYLYVPFSVTATILQFDTVFLMNPSAGAPALNRRIDIPSAGTLAEKFCDSASPSRIRMDFTLLPFCS